MIIGLNAIIGRTRDALSLATRTWYGKAGLGVIFFATVSIIVLLNPMRARMRRILLAWLGWQTAG